MHRARLDAGWAREKLAWEVGVSQTSMLRWELSGEQPQRQEHVDRLARVLDRPAGELFPGRDDGISVSTGGRSVDSGSVDAQSPLHRARLNAGWTREKLAWEVGASQASMLRWELFGKQPRRQEHVDRLARVLNRPVDELFPGRQEWKDQRKLRAQQRRRDAEGS